MVRWIFEENALDSSPNLGKWFPIIHSSLENTIEARSSSSCPFGLRTLSNEAKRRQQKAKKIFAASRTMISVTRTIHPLLLDVDRGLDPYHNVIEGQIRNDLIQQ